MVLLHIARIDKYPLFDVDASVPKYILAHSLYADTALLNTKNMDIEDIYCLPFVEPFCIDELEPPFQKPDAVMFHQTYRPEFLRIAKQLRRRGIPYILIPYGDLTKKAQRGKHLKKAMANFLLWNRFIDKAAGIQCLSKREFMATKRRHKFVSPKGVYLPVEREDVKKMGGRGEGIKGVKLWAGFLVWLWSYKEYRVCEGLRRGADDFGGSVKNLAGGGEKGGKGYWKGRGLRNEVKYYYTGI